MRRREFIPLLGCSAAAWPLFARAQQPERVRRIGVLMFTTSDEPESQARITALGQGLQEAGWSVGRNVRIDVRWSGGDFERVRRDAQELVSLGPDVLVAGIARPRRLSSKSAARCQLCSPSPSIRLDLALLRAWRGRAATPPVLPSSNTP